ncbi:MAG TPA: hypothetical protein VFJ53_08485 [Solirubrobacterales bacterium]|nr:hypothetical protein [Solirubrobacterales bacterium]
MNLPVALKDRPDAQGESGTLRVWFFLTVPALAGIVIYSLGEKSWSIFSLSALIAACAFALGALLGFLFGIPQYFARAADAPAGPARATYQPNTNLTQVSDWLTKIIIGVGLVQFGQLTDTIGRLGDSLEPSLGGNSTGKSFGIALVVGFFVIGFLVGYLYTRLRLQWAFAAADRRAFEDVLAGVVNEKIEQKGEIDAAALQMVSTRQLNPAAPEPSREELKEALAKASPAALAQAQILAQAKKMPGQPLPDRALTVLQVIDEINRENS